MHGTNYTGFVQYISATDGEDGAVAGQYPLLMVTTMVYGWELGE